MPITHGSNCAIVFINCARRTSRRSTTFPARSTPCNWNRFFAKSTPKVVILFTDPSPLRYGSIRHTFILAHYVTPLKGGWVHSISLGRDRQVNSTRFDDHRSKWCIAPHEGRNGPSPICQRQISPRRSHESVAALWS